MSLSRVARKRKQQRRRGRWAASLPAIALALAGAGALLLGSSLARQLPERATSQAPPVPAAGESDGPEPASPPTPGPVASAPIPVASDVPPAPRAKQPAPGWEKAPALAAAVERAMQGFPGRYSVAVHTLESDKEWTLRPDERYHPASTIKMPVALYALEQFRAGKLGWQETIQYTRADFESPGGGTFETSPFGGWYTVENLVGRALRYSNNVAVNMLIRRLGRANIEAWSQTIGGDLRWRPDDRMPEVTAMSEVGWWRHLHRLSQQDPQNAEKLLQPLREVAYDGRIAAGLPQGVKYLHKFGSFDGHYHDGGIIYAEPEPFVLVVMTGGAQEGEADAAIARVAAEIYKVLAK